MPRPPSATPRAPDQAPPPAEARLARALADALRAGRASPELRDAIGRYVAHARREGMSWNATRQAVRALMRDSTAGQRVTSDSDALAEHILRWCEEEHARGA